MKLTQIIITLRELIMGTIDTENFDYTPSVINFTELFGDFLGKDIFLSLSSNRSEVIATGNTPGEARQSAMELGYLNPIIMKAPKDDSWFYIL